MTLVAPVDPGTPEGRLPNLYAFIDAVKAEIRTTKPTAPRKAAPRKRATPKPKPLDTPALPVDSLEVGQWVSVRGDDGHFKIKGFNKERAEVSLYGGSGGRAGWKTVTADRVLPGEPPPSKEDKKAKASVKTFDPDEIVPEEQS